MGTWWAVVYQVNEDRCKGTLTQAAVDLTVHSTEHPNSTFEAVVGEERNVRGQHDEVRYGKVHHQDVGGAP